MSESKPTLTISVGPTVVIDGNYHKAQVTLSFQSEGGGLPTREEREAAHKYLQTAYYEALLSELRIARGTRANASDVKKSISAVKALLRRLHGPDQGEAEDRT